MENRAGRVPTTAVRQRVLSARNRLRPKAMMIVAMCMRSRWRSATSTATRRAFTTVCMAITPISSRTGDRQARVRLDRTRVRADREKARGRAGAVTARVKAKAVRSRANETVARDPVKVMVVVNTPRWRARNTANHTPAEGLPNTDLRHPTW